MDKLVRRIYLYRTLDDFMLIYPLYAVMFATRGGLSTFAISVLFIIWTITGMVFEIPTGALADRYSRRTILAVGEVIRGVGYLLWLLQPTFVGYAAGFVLWGIGGSLSSGTYQALVYDELAATGKQRGYAKLLGQTESMALLLSIVATLLAVPAFHFGGYPLVLAASIAATIAAAAAAFSLPESPKKDAAEDEPYATLIKDAAREIRRSPQLIQIIAFGVLLTTLYGNMDEYVSLYLHVAHISTLLIPVVSAAVFSPAIVAGFAAHKLERLPGSVFLIFLLAAGLGLAAAGRLANWSGIVSLAAFFLLTRVSQIVFGARLQHGMSGDTRSTVTSFSEFIASFAYLGVYLGIGLVSDHGGLGLAMVYLGLVSIAIAIGLLALRRGRQLLLTR